METARPRNNQSEALGTMTAMLKRCSMWLAACIIACAPLSSCNDDDGPTVAPIDETMAESRTVLAYMVAENSLSTFVNDDLEEMLKGMKNTSMREGDKLLVYVDDEKKPRIYCITKDTEELTFSELTAEKTFSEDCNSASAEQFGQVIDYMMQNHPASSYGLVMWSHASGWIPSTYSGDKKATQKRSFGIDNGNNMMYSNNGNQMNIDDMAKAIESRCVFDFIFFDACFMQCIEVDYALRHCTRYVIASPAEIPGPGADYSLMMKPMFKANNYAKLMVQTYYDTYYDSVTGVYKYVNGVGYGVIVSAVDESTLDHFAEYMKNVCRNNTDQLMSVNPNELLNYNNYRNYYSSALPDFMDIKGIMANTLFGVDYLAWQDEFAKVVVANNFTPKWISMFDNNTTVIADYCGGVSMFVPLENRYSAEMGNYIELIKETEWGKTLWTDLQ